MQSPNSLCQVFLLLILSEYVSFITNTDSSQIRIALVGHTGVGKTTMISRFRRKALSGDMVYMANTKVVKHLIAQKHAQQSDNSKGLAKLWQNTKALPIFQKQRH